jgi:hypothetical protein
MRSERVKIKCAEICNTLFDYKRVGHDSRPMTFLEVGAIGQGAAGCEVSWSLKDDGDGGLVLEIYSYEGVTCRLIEGIDNVWRGSWLHHEKMPIELAPIGRLTKKQYLEQSNQSKSKVIDYGITTIARQPVYIHDLIASLRPDLPLRLIVGTPDRAYLEKYSDNPFVEIIESPAEEWRSFENCSLHHRASWNYWRTLAFGSKSSSSKGLVVLEDDVIPACGWESRLYEIIDQIESRHKGLYALALYTSAGLPRPLDERTYYVPYLIEFFYGTQAMYYPNPVRAGFADYLKSKGVDSFVIEYDLLLKEYLYAADIPLFAAIPSLFQHVGRISTGLGYFHQAQEFQPKL